MRSAPPAASTITGTPMRLRLRAAALVLLALPAAGPVAAAPSGFAFLEVPAGARASALAGAFATAGRFVGRYGVNHEGNAEVVQDLVSSRGAASEENRAALR